MEKKISQTFFIRYAIIAKLSKKVSEIFFPNFFYFLKLKKYELVLGEIKVVNFNNLRTLIKQDVNFKGKGKTIRIGKTKTSRGGGTKERGDQHVTRRQEKTNRGWERKVRFFISLWMVK